MNHASGYGFRAMFLWADRYLPVSVPDYSQAGSLAFFGIVLIQQLIYFTLPAFLFVSGYFVAFSAGRENPHLKWSVVFARIKTLGIPLMIWIGIIFAFFLRRVPTSLNDALISYYYIPLLMQFYLLAPIIVRVVKRHPFLILGIGALLELSRDTIYYLDALGLQVPGLAMMKNLTPPWLLPTLFFWFILGIVAGVHRDSFSKFLSRWKRIILALLIVLIPMTLVEYQIVWNISGKEWLGPYFGGYTRFLYALAFLLCFLAYDSLPLTSGKWLSVLGSRSLGIYLAHGPVMYLVATVLYKVTPWMLGMQMFYQGVLIASGLGIPLITMEFFSRTQLRIAYHYLFG
jgi:surface polysaccharide O-acyltransferase-like enzyme